MEQSVPCAYTIFITIITVHMFFSDYLPPCLISLNNPDPQCACEHNQLVGETSIPAGSAPTAPRHISMPSSRRIAPFILMTHRRVSGVMDDDNMYGRAPVFRCLNCVKKMPHERESQSFSAPTAAASSAYRRHLVWPRSLPKASSDIRQNAFPVSV